MLKSNFVFQFFKCFCPSLITLNILRTSCAMSAKGTLSIPNRRYPAEWEPHKTYLIWPAEEVEYEGWKGMNLEGVRNEIANLANIISKYEPVSLLVKLNQIEQVKKQVKSEVIDIIPIESNEHWARDSLPIFLNDDSAGNGKKPFGVILNFNGWGNKTKYHKLHDGKIAEQLIKHLNISYIKAPFISEGGALVTDGLGTLLVTESSIVNSNRNPGKSRDQIEKELKETLGISKVIWLKGIKGEDITDEHVDALASFTSPGVVVLGRPAAQSLNQSSYFKFRSPIANEAYKALINSTDAKGNPLRVVDIYEPDRSKIRGKGEDFLSSYINFYIINGAVLIPEFGDVEADLKAQEVFKELFPGKDVIPVNIDNISSGGGGIHCSTMSQVLESE